jgi:hypothetical protein
MSDPQRNKPDEKLIFLEQSRGKAKLVEVEPQRMIAERATLGGVTSWTVHNELDRLETLMPLCRLKSPL